MEKKVPGVSRNGLAINKIRNVKLKIILPKRSATTFPEKYFL